jgi:hypothetical protein
MRDILYITSKDVNLTKLKKTGVILMTFFVNDKPYRSAAAAFRAYAEILAEKSGIAISDEPYTKASFQLTNGKYICYDKNSDTIIKLFQKAGFEAHIENTLIVDGEVDPNSTTKVSRSIPSSNKKIVSEEAETSEFVGESYDGKLYRFDLHHLIPFTNLDDIEGYIHNPANLIALNKNNHDIMHHGRVNEVIILLSKIFEAYPAKLAFIEEQGLDITDVANLSLATHK